MCGIFASVGESDVSELIIDGLSKLEYRGYDSAGICLEDLDEDFKILKTSDSQYPVNILRKKIRSVERKFFSGIGHTRWATHGSVSNLNAHPHLSYSNNLSIVHNGIVENYNFLKKLLSRKGVELKTQTDSEVIANLIELQIPCSKDISSAIFSIFKLIEGINTVAVMHKNYPNKIFGFSSDDSGGLLVGKSSTNYFLSSDAYALNNICDSVYSTNKNELITISNQCIEITDMNSEKITPKKLSFESVDRSDLYSESSTNFNFLIEKEIVEQKEILKNLINFRILHNKNTAFPEIDKNILLESKKIIFTGMGSSHNAALFGSLIYEEILGIDSKAEFSSELKHKKIINPAQTTLFAISQSGETADTLEAIKNCKSQGVNVISIVQEKNSKASIKSDIVIPLNTGKEKSVAATKTFSSTLLTLSALAIDHLRILNGDLNLVEKLKNNYQSLDNTILDIYSLFDSKIENSSKLISNSDRVFFIGKSINFPIAKEGALKLQEISKINSNAFTEGELKHGPNALLDSSTTVISIIGPEDDIKKSIGSIREILSRGSNLVVISHEQNYELKNLVDHFFVIENKNKYAFSILATIILQKLAFYSSRNLGLNPDRPDNLAKTVTVE